jgi:hypothetical protein
MTDLPALPSGTPRELLSSSRALSRRVQAAQRGAWFPLLILLVFTLGYLIVVSADAGLGWTVSLRSAWAFLPHLIITGGLLLIASLCFAWVRSGRRWRQRSST